MVSDMNQTENSLSSSPEDPAPVGTGAFATVTEALESVRWLRGLRRETFEALAAQSFLHRVPAGALLFDQAETPAFMQILLSGAIACLGARGGQEALIEFVRPVDFVIPAAGLTSRPYLMRARVALDAQIVLTPAVAFRALAPADPALAAAVIAILGAQFRRQVKARKALALRSAEERVGAYLMALTDGARRERAPLPESKQVIATLLGMTRETLSRSFSAMSAYGLRVIGDAVVLSDPDAARARFPFDPQFDADDADLPA